MRVLFLTETVPFPLDSGGRIKTFNVLRMLSREHEVHCHSFVREPIDLKRSSDLTTRCRTVELHLVERSLARELGYATRGLLKNVPFVVERHFDAKVLRLIRAATHQTSFDCVYCDHLSMIEYGRHLALPIVYDAHNVEFEILRRHGDALGWAPIRPVVEVEWRRLRRYERHALESSALVFAVSREDAKALRVLASDSVTVKIAPISIDVASMMPVGPLVREPELLFVGGLHWPPNADAVRYFLREIWPTVLRETPDVHLTVVGRIDSRTSLPDVPHVSFAGYVDDVEPHFKKSRAMIVPLRAASGMRVKILDALGRGLPVVSTSIGCEGIEAVAGVHVLKADSPDDFARAVVTVLRDDRLAAALALGGRQLAESRYDCSVVEGTVLEAMRRFRAEIRGRKPANK